MTRKESCKRLKKHPKIEKLTHHHNNTVTIVTKPLDLKAHTGSPVIRNAAQFKIWVGINMNTSHGQVHPIIDLKIDIFNVDISNRLYQWWPVARYNSGWATCLVDHTYTVYNSFRKNDLEALFEVIFTELTTVRREYIHDFARILNKEVEDG